MNWALGPKLPAKAKRLLRETGISRNFNEVSRVSFVGILPFWMGAEH